MKQIDHNPREKRPGNGVWWVMAVGLVWCWGGLFYFSIIDWISAIGGLGTGIVFALWAIEKTGNKWPFSEPSGR